MYIEYIDIGDSAIQVSFGAEISEDTNTKVYAMAQLLDNLKLPGIVEIVPAYCTLTIYYNCILLPRQVLLNCLKAQETKLKNKDISVAEVLEIPVYYGGELGPDLSFVAKHTGLTEEEVVVLHCAPNYRIYMLGFMPGFTYLGGLREKLHTPRLTTPRIKIKAGSVGIAGSQTGIYPLDSPGGWQLIGNTPVRLFDPNRNEPFLLKAGHYIHFTPIDYVKYLEISEQVLAGKYICKSYPLTTKEGGGSHECKDSQSGTLDYSSGSRTNWLSKIRSIKRR